VGEVHIASFPNDDTTDLSHINACQIRVKTNTSGSNYYELRVGGRVLTTGRGHPLLPPPVGSPAAHSLRRGAMVR
jgi:hypothetical protein